MKTYKNIFAKLCSFENLELAYELAKKRKSTSKAIQEFEKHWQLHLCILMNELKTKTYKPQPLKKFILRDPKTRVICVSNFRDRVIHHALVNILKPIFEPRFIHDSYASRKGKGTRSSRKLLKKLSGRETRWMKWVNHNISKNIVSQFNGNKIVMENLKGIRKQRRGKRMNYWISNWSFFRYCPKIGMLINE